LLNSLRGKLSAWELEHCPLGWCHDKATSFWTKKGGPQLILLVPSGKKLPNTLKKEDYFLFDWKVHCAPLRLLESLESQSYNVRMQPAVARLRLN
jgi:hypothetical protein